MVKYDSLYLHRAVLDRATVRQSRDDLHCLNCTFPELGCHSEQLTDHGNIRGERDRRGRAIRALDHRNRFNIKESTDLGAPWRRLSTKDIMEQGLYSILQSALDVRRLYIVGSVHLETSYTSCLLTTF